MANPWVDFSQSWQWKKMALALWLLLHPTTVSSVTSERPNFVLMFMDDLGYGDLGFTGHPTTRTPNIDKLAWNGKILTTWYSGCSVCTGSRAALMTGRQFPRTGLPGVLGPIGNTGLPLNETTIAEQLQMAGYKTAVIGKWHLGQRQVYLPGNRGFDYYLGIPYSDDMGDGIASTCPVQSALERQMPATADKDHEYSNRDQSKFDILPQLSHDNYQALDDFQGGAQDRERSTRKDPVRDDDPASKYLPLVYQEYNKTKVLEQPLDFTTLAIKYNDFAMKFLENHKANPFLLYLPFSHVHATSASQPEMQYSGCDFKNSTPRGAFGDALEESDWIIGNIVNKLQELQLLENTLILFTSDNGPWMLRGLSGGSRGLFTGQFAGYDDTAKASTWEGGIRMPAFAYWKGTIPSFGRSSEIISSLDVFPTLSALAGIPLPANRTYDGKDMSDILLDNMSGEMPKSKHEFLFFYGTCHDDPYWSVSAVRHGQYKAHFCTAPGSTNIHNESLRIVYDKFPLLFDVDKDPSESAPISPGNVMPSDPEHRAAMERIMKAYAMEQATFSFGTLVPHPDGPGEGPGAYGVCCDRSKECNCNGESDSAVMSRMLSIGTKRHHDRYHAILGEEEPSPPKTKAQILLQQQTD